MNKLSGQFGEYYNPGNITCSDPEICLDFSYYDDFENATFDYDRYDKNIVNTFRSRNSISSCHRMEGYFPNQNINLTLSSLKQPLFCDKT